MKNMIVLVGNPVDGLRIFGPFTPDEANTFADEELNGGDEWWMHELEQTT